MEKILLPQACDALPELNFSCQIVDSDGFAFCLFIANRSKPGQSTAN